MKLSKIFIVIIVFNEINQSLSNIKQYANRFEVNKTISNLTKNENEKFVLYKNLGNYITAILSPVLLIIGGFGNPLCIAVLLNKKNRNSTVIYLCILATFDFLVLYTGLMRQYINQIWNIDLRNISNSVCKLHIFLTYTLMQISSYILVAVTYNRFTIIFNYTLFCKRKFIIRMPNRLNNKNSNRPVYTIVLIISCLISIWNFPFLYYYEKIEQSKDQNSYLSHCTINRNKYPNFFTYRTKYYAKVHLYMFIVIPCFILFILNILIIKKIMASSKNLNSKNKKNEKKRTSLSVMLFSVCLWFMILKTPASIYLTFPVQEMSKAYFPFIYNLLMLINYTNHAVNFILYLTTSSEFRNEIKYFVKKSFKGVKRKNYSESS